MVIIVCLKRFGFENCFKRREKQNKNKAIESNQQTSEQTNKQQKNAFKGMNYIKQRFEIIMY